jgi:PAS domain-containing protein
MLARGWSNGILEIVLSADGRYLGANQAALDALGYTLDELVRLDLGALSDFPDHVAQQAWQMVISGAIELTGDQPTELRRKDGSPLHAVVLEIERTTDGHYVSRMERRTGTAPIDRSLQNVLAEWRKAERELAAMSDGAGGAWAALESEIERLRNEYQSIARERQEATA